MHRQQARQRRDLQPRQQRLHAGPVAQVVVGDESDAGASGHQPPVADRVVRAQGGVFARGIVEMS
jgi:hypothetical protein